MIFVTVGTHEQQFDRLVKAVDDLTANGIITEFVFIQTGYSTYEPKHCKWAHFVSYVDMVERMRKADVIITHGGPSSFTEAMAAGKVPVVVPRRRDLGEHVNDHQVEFVRQVAGRQGGIIPIYNVIDLPVAIETARIASKDASFKSHNAKFCKEFEYLIERL